MRQKTKRLVITFHTTTEAMAMEKYCRQSRLSGRLIPVPQQISAGCGMAWCAEPEERAKLQQELAQAGIDVEGFYEVVL